MHSCSSLRLNVNTLTVKILKIGPFFPFFFQTTVKKLKMMAENTGFFFFLKFSENDFSSTSLQV